jgi:redox-sensitive bicupin YhaK (pirin superfamily)
MRGPAKTFTPIHLYDLRVKAGRRADVTVPARFNTAVFVLQGEVAINGSGPVKEAELARLDKAGEHIVIEARSDATVLVLSGEAINEPIARYGPFVMNTQAELVQAVDDYRMGKMGHLD